MNLEDLVPERTREQIADQLQQSLEAVGFVITAFGLGDAAEQLFVGLTETIRFFATTVHELARSNFLEFATDPGDDGVSDPAKGWLSAKGEGDYYTFRGEETPATGTVTFTNSSGSEYDIAAESITLQNAVTFELYRNSVDFVIPPFGSVDSDIHAEKLGTIGNASAGEVSLLVDGLIGVTVTNAAPVLGTDRQTRTAYIAACRQQAAATSPNGPADAYRYIATNANRDGTIGGDGSNRLNINRVTVTKDSSIGAVDAYFASPAGAVDAGEFTILDGIIQQYAVPEGITYTSHNAVEVSVDVTYTVRVKSGPGVSAPVIEAAILAGLEAYFSSVDTPIGGFDQSGGTGYLYADDIKAPIASAHPAIFKTTLTLPAGDVALNIDEVATLGTVTPTVVIV